MPKLLQPKTLKKQKSLKELHEEATKDLEYIELPLHDTPNPNFVSETYEEWLEEMEYEESLLLSLPYGRNLGYIKNALQSILS